MVKSKFERHLEPEVIGKLKNAPLFINKLEADCKKGIVFPAVRKSYMSFYHAGGSLFTYNYITHRFATHIKYAFVPTKDIKGDYVTSEGLRNARPEHNFALSYKDIKTQCKKHNAKTEADTVSQLYKFSPMSTKGDSDRYYLVDIEIAFPGGTDRIDLLLYDNDTKQLLFCEAKHFEDPRLFATVGGDPEVVGQLNRYNAQIAAHKKDIVDQYERHFDVLRKLFGVELNKPVDVHEHCGLLLFGFDEAHRKEPLKKWIQHFDEHWKHKHYEYGHLNSGQFRLKTLYEKLVR